MNDKTSAVLFKTLDLDKDGFLSRADLNNSAKRLGWSWHEAPLLAVFDLLSIAKPIPQSEFITLVQQIQNDPLGPYGNVLLESQHFLKPASLRDNRISNDMTTAANNRVEIKEKGRHVQPDFESFTGLLKNVAGTEAALQYQSLLKTFKIQSIQAENAAVLIIDPQRSFTKGAWMHSIGYGGKLDVMPIRAAFRNCASFLARYYGRMKIMFTRCPFPADSYGWDRQLANILDRDQLYFIKPGNSVLFPSTNGFTQWVGHCLEHGNKTLVVCGCTLNSCVRVSAIETSRKFRDRGLKVVVDLSMAGARTNNYISAPGFNGLSAVESAVAQMLEEGIKVVRQVEWN